MCSVQLTSYSQLKHTLLFVANIKCIRFAVDMALLAEDEKMLKNMLMELNERCEDYGMKINISKTKAMVMGRKPKKIGMLIKYESVEEVDNFKYLVCNISRNMNCYQEVKQRIAMEKEAFNRKRRIFCGPLEKELRKRLVKCFLWSVGLYGAETWTLRRNEKRTTGSIWDVDMVKHRACKMDRGNKKWSCARKSGRKKNKVGTNKEEVKKLAGPLAKKELPAERCCRRNDKLEENSRQKNMLGDRQHYDKWNVWIAYEKKGREKARVENAQFAVKYLPLGRTLRLFDINFCIF